MQIQRKSDIVYKQGRSTLFFCYLSIGFQINAYQTYFSIFIVND
jgi:hypothetical protein